MTRNTGEGLRNEALREALSEALSGKPRRLCELLIAHSALPSPRPNLKLAAAFGNEIGGAPAAAARLLTALAAEDAAPDDPRVFLPVVAAHGFAGRIRAGREVEESFTGLAQLAADERGPVRIGTLDALISLGVREGGADTLVTRGREWLASDERELRYGATALMLEALGDKAVLATLTDHEALLGYLTGILDEVADAPRAAERSDGRRRILLSLPRSLAAAAASIRGGARGVEWLREQCERTTHPDLRKALSQSIEALRTGAHGQSGAVIESLRKSLSASAKPVRDQARVRLAPGQGRGRRSRQIR